MFEVLANQGYVISGEKESLLSKKSLLSKSITGFCERLQKVFIGWMWTTEMPKLIWTLLTPLKVTIASFKRTKQIRPNFVSLSSNKKVILGTKFKRCVQHHELRATDCYFLGGFARSNLSKPCAIPSITFLSRCSTVNTSRVLWNRITTTRLQLCRVNLLKQNQ